MGPTEEAIEVIVTLLPLSPEWKTELRSELWRLADIAFAQGTEYGKKVVNETI